MPIGQRKRAVWFAQLGRLGGLAWRDEWAVAEGDGC